MTSFNADIIINLPQTEQGEAAWSMALAMTPDLEFIRQQHEVFLTDLEALAVQALATRDWEAVYTHIANVSTGEINLSESERSGEDFVQALAFINRLLGEASTKDLTRPGADLLSQTEK